jgi:hypothetical protein
VYSAIFVASRFLLNEKDMKYQVGNTVSLSADNRKHLYAQKKKFGDLSILYQKSKATSMPKNGKI